MGQDTPAFQQCIRKNCEATYEVVESLTSCKKCGDLLDVRYDWERVPIPSNLCDFERYWSQRHEPTRFSGVWRFQELLPFTDPGNIVTVGEGQTLLRHSPRLAAWAGLKGQQLFLQYEGMNPSGSFKDNGMTAAMTHAKMVAAQEAACASTGNTSASLAMYAANSGMRSFVFIGSGKIAYGKLSQALDFGAKTIQIDGDFDDAMARVREVCNQRNIYLVNSVNPFRLEGQKAIMFRVLEALKWQVPDWILVPGGNLGNSSSFGKAFEELLHLGLIDRAPKLAVINAEGANTLSHLYNELQIRQSHGEYDREKCNQFFDNLSARADTLASAIEINRPVNLAKCLRALDVCDGVVEEVSDQEIVDAKALIGAHGLGCEPASAASFAGLKKLIDNRVIDPDERVVCILTGHQLKDPDVTVAYHANIPKMFEEKLASRGVHQSSFGNHPHLVANELASIIELIDELAKQNT